MRLKIPAVKTDGNASRSLEGALRESGGIRWVRINRPSMSVIVRYEQEALQAEEIIARIREAIGLRSDSIPVWKRGGGELRENLIQSALLRFIGMSVLGGIVLFRQIALKIAPAGSLLSPLGLITIVAAMPLVKKGVSSLGQGRITLESLLGGSIIAAVAAGEAMAALEVLWITSAGDLLQSWITERSRRAVRDILQVTEKSAYILADGVEVSLPVQEIKPGDTVVLHTGEKIAVDGVIVKGEALVDESPINGRSEPVLRRKDEHVLAGSFVREGVIFVEARRVGDRTYLARILRMVEESLENKAPIEGVADRLAKKLVTAGFAATLATLAVTGSFWRAFTVMLVMACPCATILAASTAISAALSAAARRRILIKGGRYLEEVGRADVICFDKTGTLTTNQPQIKQLIVLDGLPEDGLLQFVYSTEIHNSHPVALAIKAEATKRGIEPIAHDVCEYFLGKGVRSEIRGEEVLVGSHKLMEQFGVSPEEVKAQLEKLKEEGLTLVFVARKRRLMGVIGFANQDRPHVEEVIRYLRGDGVKRTAMVTGDSRRAALPMALRLDLDDCWYSALPEEKAEVVAGLKRDGEKVLMVGDGINDALALAEADIGVAMGAGGSEVAIEAADIALVEDDLKGVVYVRALSRKTIGVVHQNFWIATGTNVLGVVLGALGLLSPVTAGLTHIAHTFGILANSSRLLFFEAPDVVSRDSAADSGIGGSDSRFTITCLNGCVGESSNGLGNCGRRAEAFQCGAPYAGTDTAQIQSSSGGSSSGGRNPRGR